MDETSFYYFVLVILIICAFLMYRFITSPFGRALQGIREDERLMQHLGYNTWLSKYITFIVAGLFAGVAGILFGHSNSILVSSNLSVTMSTMVMLMVIIGGSTTVFGPVIGAAVVLFLQYYASILTPERWPLVLGGAFVVSVMFLRGGVSIYLLRLWNIIKRRYGYGNTAD
jgi:branched-chain amino acid transport system permease protein